jgi:hypothetical protein
MDLTKINTSALRNLMKLTERKEALVNEIEKIESQLASLFSGKAVSTGSKRRGRPAKKGRPGRPAGKKVKAAKSAPGKVKRRAPRGALKKKIFAALKAAGNAGMKVTDLSKKIGVKNANVHVWFSSTGRNLPEIKKVGKGHFKFEDKK